MECVDDLSQDANKFFNYQRQYAKQQHAKQQVLQKRVCIKLIFRKWECIFQSGDFEHSGKSGNFNKFSHSFSRILNWIVFVKCVKLYTEKILENGGVCWKSRGNFQSKKSEHIIHFCAVWIRHNILSLLGFTAVGKSGQNFQRWAATTWRRHKQDVQTTTTALSPRQFAARWTNQLLCWSDHRVCHTELWKIIYGRCPTIWE